MVLAGRQGLGFRRRGKANRVERTATVMLSVSLVVLLVFFYAPVIGLLARSVRPSGHGSPWSSYDQILTQGQLTSTLKQSFVIAGLSFGVMLLIGYPLAWLICFKSRPRWQLPMLLLLVISGSISDIIRIFAWYSVLGYNGLLNRFLITIGIVNHPLQLLFTRLAVVIVLTTGWLPYVVIPIYSAMRTIDSSHLEAARDLYSSQFGAIKNVVIPMSAPGILGAFIIVFVPILSDFATPQLVGGPSSLMVGNFVSDQLLQVGNWSSAAAAATLLLGVSIALIVAAQRVMRRYYGG